MSETTRCFRCRKLVLPVIPGGSPWDCPAGAVRLRGGNACGSALYDAAGDGVEVELLVCDACLRAHERLTREVQGEAE